MLDDATVLAAVDSKASLAAATIDFVHAHPELGHCEHACATYLAETLADSGLTAELGAGGMETAFRAVLEGARPGGTVGIVFPAARLSAGRTPESPEFLAELTGLIAEHRAAN
jgi:hypothetical protein